MAPEQPGLWAESAEFPMKKRMGELIDEIETERAGSGVPFTLLDRAKREIALSIAESIDRGNRKGRASANEHEQLDRLLEQLAGSGDDDDSNSSIPAHVREMMASFAFHAPAAPARTDPASSGDSGA